MHDHLEQEIYRSRTDSEHVELPISLDEMIQVGIMRGKREQVRKQRIKRRTVWASAVVCVFFLSFVLSIRFSPTFASMVRDIPGMDGFVKLVQKTMDRGVRLAVDHEFIQPIGVSDEHDGIDFTVEGIIADDSRLVIFYSIDREQANRFVEFGSIKMFDQNDQNVGGMFAYSHPEEKENWQLQGFGIQQGMIDVAMVAGKTIPNEVQLKVNLFYEGEDKILSPSNEFNIHFKIDHKFFAEMREEYEINQTIDIEGEKLNFLKAVVHPLNIELHIQFDPNNRRDLISVADMRFVDEKGNEMRRTHNSGPEDGKQVLYFESSYFHKPKHLWLEGELFRALEKDKMDLIIDTNKKQILQAPDEKIKIKSINRAGSATEIAFELDGIDPDDNMLYSLLSPNYIDGDGRQYQEMYQEGGITRTVTTTGSPDKQEVHFYITNEAYVQPLTFKITEYPSYIREKYRIQVK